MAQRFKAIATGMAHLPSAPEAVPKVTSIAEQIPGEMERDAGQATRNIVAREHVRIAYP